MSDAGPTRAIDQTEGMMEIVVWHESMQALS
jgi:hypothetical protein